jgi:hypothetical protein
VKVWVCNHWSELGQLREDWGEEQALISAKRWWFVALLFASVTALIVTVGGVSAVAAPSSDPGAAPPGEVTVETGALGQVAFFTTYPDMSTCELVFLTDCYGFTDGTVEGEEDPDTFVNEFVSFLPAPLAGLLDDLPFATDVTEPDCFDIPAMGSSADIDEVSDGTDLALEVGPGDCSDIVSDVEAGTEDIVNSDTDTTITPVDGESSYIRPRGGLCRGNDLDLGGICFPQSAGNGQPAQPTPPAGPPGRSAYPRPPGGLCSGNDLDLGGICFPK